MAVNFKSGIFISLSDLRFASGLIKQTMVKEYANLS